MKRFQFIAVAAAIAIGAVVGSPAPASAGILGDVVKAVGNKVHDRAQNNNRPAPTQQQPQQQQAQSGKGKWDWLGNKPYLDCLNLYHYGTFGIPAGATPAQKADYQERGRRYCNRQFYGHD